MNYLEEYYNNYDEEGRLLSKHGQVEYLTTMKYIKECLEGISEPNILEVGAGTGRYSVTLAKQGLKVTAVELIKHNLEILKSKLNGTEPINAIQGNALDLSMFEDDTFDMTMLLGPMYHLFTQLIYDIEIMVVFGNNLFEEMVQQSNSFHIKKTLSNCYPTVGRVFSSL